MIGIETQIGSTDKQPYVVLKWGEESGRLTPNEARQHALRILEAADAAESDGFILNFFMERIKLDVGQSVQFLADFRKYRDIQRTER